MVHIPKAVYKAVYAHLYENASLALKEYWRVGNVPGITYVDENGKLCNPTYLHVNCIMQSLESRGVVKDTFAWRHHYYLLTEKGEQFIRKELDLTDDVLPTPYSKPNIKPPQYAQCFSSKGKPDRAPSLSPMKQSKI